MGDEPKKILVHTCCSACFSYVHSILAREGYHVVAFFYNPCTHGRAEYNKRLLDLEHYCEKNKLKLIVPEYDVQEFFAPLMPLQDKSSIKFIKDKKRFRTKRCQFCYNLLLGYTAAEAKKRKFAFFTTTMLTTPYKDHDEIMNIGLELEQESKVKFIYKDFRKGYWQGRNYARSHKMHIATYCGCSYSLQEGLLE